MIYENQIIYGLYGRAEAKVEVDAGTGAGAGSACIDLYRRNAKHQRNRKRAAISVRFYLALKA